jgi:putative septum site determining protein
MAAELDVDRVIPLRTLRNLQSDLDHGMRVGDRKRSATARDIANLARICGDAA